MENAIHKAARKHDWEGCKLALLDSLVQGGQIQSAELCMSYFEVYIPCFCGGTKHDEWFKDRVKDIQGSKLFSESGSLLPPFPDLDVKFNDSKIRTVKWALFHFWSAARFYQDNQIRASKLTEAIASMITVFRREHPHWMPQEHNTESIRLLDSRSYGEILWIGLADKLDLTFPKAQS
jgi:hypothetical protein